MPLLYISTVISNGIKICHVFVDSSAPISSTSLVRKQREIKNQSFLYGWLENFSKTRVGMVQKLRLVV